MGGGDLNSKKSWHPNTMKNQERVWKAEQAAAQEKQRIQELQREHAEERDRFELNNMIKQNSSSASGLNDNRLHWMYDKPDRKGEQEDYLLGKSIEKNYDNVEKQQDAIPAVARRVIGSSMLSSAGDSQVDLARKLREDPLLLVKERERAARAALLNNPLQRKRLTELLRKEQEQKKDHKQKKTKKKDKDLDKQLAAKLNALSGGRGLNLATLLASDTSDTDTSSSEEEKSKKRHKHTREKKRQKKKKKRKHSSTEESSTEDEKINQRKVKQDSKEASQKKRKSMSFERESGYKRKPYYSDQHSRLDRNKQNKYDAAVDDKRKKDDKYESNDRTHKDKRESYSRPDQYDRHRYESNEMENDKRHYRSKQNRKDDRYESKSKGMSSEERAAKLAAMAAAGAEREQSRVRRVAEQRVAEQRDAVTSTRPHPAPRSAHALPESLEARIHSNRHYIQRDRRHMDEHFARR